MLGAPDLRMIIRVTKGFQSNQCVEHRRKDRCQPIASFKSLKHPALRFPERQFTEWTEPILFNPLMKPVQPKQKIAQRERSRVARQRQIALVISSGMEIIQRDVGRISAGGEDILDEGHLIK